MLSCVFALWIGFITMCTVLNLLDRKGDKKNG